MNKLISFRMAVRVSTLIFALFAAFHLLVMLGYLPNDIIWGGKIKSRTAVLVMESVSVMVLLLAAVLVLSKARILLKSFSRRADKLIWLLPLVFVLNSVGNILAENLFERLVFTPVTLLLALLSFRIALERFEEKI